VTALLSIRLVEHRRPKPLSVLRANVHPTCGRSIPHSSASALPPESKSGCVAAEECYDSAPAQILASPPLVVATNRSGGRCQPAPAVFPVHFGPDDSPEHGVAFKFSPGVVFTCEHCVGTNVTVAGAPASVIAVCAADAAILHVQALAIDEPDPLFADVQPLLEEGEPIEIGRRVRILNASSHSVYARVAGMPAILYRSSGAVLPSLLLEVERHAITRGWSGSPVLCAETGALLGMVAHGTTSITSVAEDESVNRSRGDFIHAVPSALLHWLYCKAQRHGCDFDRVPIWHGIGAISPLTVQPLRDSAVWKAVVARMQMSTCPSAAIAASAIRRGGIRGARIVRASTVDGGLQIGDIIVQVNGFDVDWDGCIKWKHGLSTGLQAAFIGLAPGERSVVSVIRAEEGGERVDVNVTLGMAEQSALGVDIKSRGVAVDGGNGVVRLVEVSVERLSQWFGTDWERECGGELSEIVRGAHEPHGVWREHIVVDAQWCSRQDWQYDNKISGRSAAASSMPPANSGWPSMGGMVVAKVNGREVYRLEEVVEIANRKQNQHKPNLAEDGGGDEECVVVEMRNGYIAVLPQPVRLVHEGHGEELWE
jgi:hypothetical protein